EWPHQIAKGADFYMQPVWHPDGKKIAWVEWDHPNMPWDETRVMLGTLEGDPLRVVEVTTAAHKPDMPAQDPRFSPNGRWLSYIIASGEWDALVLVDLEHGTEKRIEADGFTFASNAW